jgi:hypothetical protein
MEQRFVLERHCQSWSQPAPLAHACNASYLGGRDQEDRGSKPAWTLSQKYPIQKRAWPSGSSSRAPS